ncbi:MAG: TRAP transporter TatT component family protein [Spirochaetia bacterium]|nr:TRAP transporter TatT component family protein [Spirochaetia bacterium]
MKKIFPVLIAASLLMFSAGCSIKRMTINATSLFMDDVVEEFMAEEDVDFARAAGPANLKLLDGLIKGSNYENDDLLLKGCKLYGMYSMGFYEDVTTDKKQEKILLKKASGLYKKAKEYGMKALLKNNDFKQAADAGPEDFTKSMAAFGKSDAETLFWTAYAWGCYINLNRNVTENVADLPKVIAMINRVVELDDTYFYGLPHLFLIVFYSMPPMFGGDQVKAMAEYNRIKAISGDKFILAEYFMAKYYCQQTLDRELFDSMMEKVENAAPNVIPERLFTGVAKRKAEILKARADDIF